MGSKTHLSISGFCLVSAPISLLLGDDTLKGMLLKHPISNMDRTVGATGGGNSMVIRLILFVHGNIFSPSELKKLKNILWIRWLLWVQIKANTIDCY